ncbi:hypothetical protein O0L34_g7824 [Tuta absoluta]|nr:hypothetical protein O0L34_g7824 [Tuta absoluta]
MSRQSLIDNYFKLKGSPSNTRNKKPDLTPTMSNNVRKRSLSLIKPLTPSKTPKVTEENKNVSDVINLCSDDEDILENSPKKRSPCEDLTQRSNDSEEAISDCSASTIIYSPENPRTPRKFKNLSPSAPGKYKSSTSRKQTKQAQRDQTNRDGQENNNPTQSTENMLDIAIKTEPGTETPKKSTCSFQTPKKTPHSGSTLSSSQSQSSSHKSPSSREKFYSPVRKRSVVKRTSNGPQRHLDMASSTASRILFEDDLFSNACEGMDDKTIFLLEIINKYLNTPSLKCLLSTESQTLLSNCLLVVKPGMRLVCRLYWRREGWFKKEQVTQICSEETDAIDDESFQAMVLSLVENGLLVQSCTNNITFDQFIAILKKDDLVEICKELKMNINSKQSAVEALRSFSKRTSNISNFLTGYTSSNSKRVLNMMSRKAGCCYKLSDAARCTLYNLYLLMYLGMDFSIIRDKRLELMLIYDKIQRETYPIDKNMPLDDASVVFKSKDDFDRYLAAHHIYEDHQSCTEPNDKCNIVKQALRLYQDISEEEMERYTSLPRWLQRFTPASIFIKVLSDGIQDLKRDKQYELAIEILDLMMAQAWFRQHKKAEWYAEKALILHTCLHRYDEAAKVLIEGFKSDLPDEAKECLRPRASRIIRQKNITLHDALRGELMCADVDSSGAILEKSFNSNHIYKQPMERTGKRGKVKFETRRADAREVQEAEEFCIAHYLCTKQFTDGEHWEGRIVNCLFFLLFWDIIYSRAGGAPGVFLSYYQQVPLDLHTEAFYTNRKEAIDTWLEVIEGADEDTLIRIMHDTWKQRPEHEISSLSRGAVSWEQVRGVAACLGGRRVSRVCRRLATNYRHARSGFPDLTLWNVHTKQIKFVEVKTDTDKPSMKQLQWMQYLRTHDIDTEFCYVGGHTTRQRCRVNTHQHSPEAKVKKERKKKAKVKTEPGVKTEPQTEHETEAVINETQMETQVDMNGTETETQTIANGAQIETQTIANGTQIETQTIANGTPIETQTIANESQANSETYSSSDEFESKVKSEPDVETESMVKAHLLSDSGMLILVPLVVMSAVSAMSVLYLYCANRNTKKGYITVNEKPSDDG